VTVIVASSHRKLLIQLYSANIRQCEPKHYWFGSTHDAFTLVLHSWLRAKLYTVFYCTVLHCTQFSTVRRIRKATSPHRHPNPPPPQPTPPQNYIKLVGNSCLLRFGRSKCRKTILCQFPSTFTEAGLTKNQKH
jgi:hypothetical protein